MSNPPSPKVTVFDDTCFLLQNFLSVSEQLELYSYIASRDRTPWSILPVAMVPSPKTLTFDTSSPQIPLTSTSPSPATSMVDRCHSYVLGNSPLNVPTHCGSLLRTSSVPYVSLGAIRYKAPDGKFPPHVDHCSGSLVYLMTLGCCASFMVKTPGLEDKVFFDLKSGDMLVFDATTEANVLHAVTGIWEGSCPEELGEEFEVLKGHRFGVQCRVRVGEV